MENNAPNIPIIGDIMKAIGGGLETLGEFFNSLSKEPATKTETVLIGYQTITEQKWIREDGGSPKSISKIIAKAGKSRLTARAGKIKDCNILKPSFSRRLMWRMLRLNS
jgi:hypothetical protein